MRGLLVAAAAAAALALAAQAPAHTNCTDGVKTVGGVTYRSFCGSAKATVVTKTGTLRFAGGECSKSGGAFSVNIGTITLPPGKPKFQYFGVAVFNTRAGTFSKPAPAVTWQLPGGKRGSLLYSTVTIAPGLKKGSFKGTLIGTNSPVHGVFSC